MTTQPHPTAIHPPNPTILTDLSPFTPHCVFLQAKWEQKEMQLKLQISPCELHNLPRLQSGEATKSVEVKPAPACAAVTNRSSLAHQG